MSQRQLASKGVTYAYISRIEAGQRNPSVKALRTLARKLDVTPEYLEFGQDPPNLIRVRRAALVARKWIDDPRIVDKNLDRILAEVG